MIRYIFLKGTPNECKAIVLHNGIGAKPDPIFMTDDKPAVIELAKAMSRQWGPIVVRAIDYTTNKFLENITVVNGEVT